MWLHSKIYGMEWQVITLAGAKSWSVSQYGRREPFYLFQWVILTSDPTQTVVSSMLGVHTIICVGDFQIFISGPGLQIPFVLCLPTFWCFIGCHKISTPTVNPSPFPQDLGSVLILSLDNGPSFQGSHPWHCLLWNPQCLLTSTQQVSLFIQLLSTLLSLFHA